LDIHGSNASELRAIVDTKLYGAQNNLCDSRAGGLSFETQRLFSVPYAKSNKPIYEIAENEVCCSAIQFCEHGTFCSHCVQKMNLRDLIFSQTQASDVSSSQPVPRRSPPKSPAATVKVTPVATALSLGEEADTEDDSSDESLAVQTK
jgi:hypothetical protein